MASVIETTTFHQTPSFPANAGVAPYPTQHDKVGVPIDIPNSSGHKSSFTQPSTPQNRKMSYGMGGYSQPNGLQQGTQNSYSNSNVPAPQQNVHGGNRAPSIYTVCPFPPLCGCCTSQRFWNISVFEPGIRMFLRQNPMPHHVVTFSPFMLLIRRCHCFSLPYSMRSRVADSLLGRLLRSSSIRNDHQWYYPAGNCGHAPTLGFLA